MRHKQLQCGHGFRIVQGDSHSQGVRMTLAPGEAEGGPDYRHRGADQWLYVVSGSGVAMVEGERVELREDTLVLIQRRERHEIRNTGDTPPNLWREQAAGLRAEIAEATGAEGVALGLS